MAILSIHEIQSVVNLAGAERYSYFIKRVADSEKVWALRNKDGWVSALDANGNEVIPVWSHSEYAKLCANDEWKDCAPRFIILQDWLDRWIPGMIKDKRRVGVFPTVVSKGVVVDPERLCTDLNNELSKFEE
ncbi:MAG: DUF2750 domain-containing protein [Candidatus Omnitrophica bacterium]|nr:DUF2750 domain-containing protein [Candidatus Omnitrophota bacterium]